MDNLRWLLVGAGDIVRKRVAAALAGAEGSEIVGVCSRRRETAQSLAAEYDVAQVFDNLDEALEKSSADAVYIATPVELHVPQAVRALEGGKHVLVEKPLGVSGSDAARAVAAAKSSPDKVAGCAYYRRLYPAYRHTQEMVEKGAFGRIVLVRMVYFAWFDPAPDDPKYWRVVRTRSGGGPVADMGCHMLDLMVGLMGVPVRVYARCENLAHAWDVEDSASMVMALQEGAQATASFGWNSKTWRHEFEIVGTEAKVYWHPYDSGEVIKTVGRDVETLDLKPAENVHQPLVEDFVGAVREGRQPACPLADAARTNMLMDAIYRSSVENRAVEVT